MMIGRMAIIMTAFLLESDHLSDFLIQYELEEIVSIISAWDNFFHGNERDEYLEQVENSLGFAIERCCEVDVSGCSVDSLIEEAIHSAYSSEYDSFNIGSAIDWLDEALRDVECDELRQKLDSLPEDLKWLRYEITPSNITISGTEELIQEYLANPPGHHESDDENDSTIGYSPIDAIFER